MATRKKIAGPCGWCNEAIPAGAETCPTCNATAPKSIAVEIPGLTTISPELLAADARVSAHVEKLGKSRLVNLLVNV